MNDKARELADALDAHAADIPVEEDGQFGLAYKLRQAAALLRASADRDAVVRGVVKSMKNHGNSLLALAPASSRGAAFVECADWLEAALSDALSPQAEPAEPTTCGAHGCGPKALLGQHDTGCTTALMLAAQSAQVEPSAVPDDNAVICPGCSHQFRAIPSLVQKMLVEAGYEPPFTNPRITRPSAVAGVDEREALLPGCGLLNQPVPLFTRPAEVTELLEIATKIAANGMEFGGVYHTRLKAALAALVKP